MKKKYIKGIVVVVMILSLIGIVWTLAYTQNGNMADRQPMMSQEFNDESLTGGPDDRFGDVPLESENKQTLETPPQGNQDEMMNGQDLNMMQVVIIGIFVLTFSSSFMYLFMSYKHEKFYKNKEKLIIYILTDILLTICLTFGAIVFAHKISLENGMMMPEETSEKESVVLDKSYVVSDSEINLSTQNSDVTIAEGGTYTLTGQLTHSIIVDTEADDVHIILNGVAITQENTAALIVLSAGRVTITLADGTENILSDGGNSEYDGCIYSNAELIFEGTGTLIVQGNQDEGEGIATEAQNITFCGGTYQIVSQDDGINAGGEGATITFNDGTFYIDASGDGIDSNQNVIINGGTIFVIGSDVGGDAGIDTDDGFEINGGCVIALGSDMIETPLETSTQKSVAFSLSESLTANTIVTFMKDDEIIVSFEAPKSFQTIIISCEQLEDGDYTLYTGGTHTGVLNNGIYQDGEYSGGEKLTLNQMDVFTVSDIVNVFGDHYK